MRIPEYRDPNKRKDPYIKVKKLHHQSLKVLLVFCFGAAIFFGVTAYQMNSDAERYAAAAETHQYSHEQCSGALKVVNRKCAIWKQFANECISYFRDLLPLPKEQ